MKLIGVILVLAVGSLFAQPTNILVYHDVSGGYGTAVLTAIDNLWPSCNVEAYTGYPGSQQSAFNTAFNGPTDWDIVILECWYASTDAIDWPAITDAYDTNSGQLLFVSNWQWNLGGSGQMALAEKMGCNTATDLMNIQPHYVWDAGHPIVQGISNWNQVDPGIIRKGTAWWWDNATPVTGWTATSTPGQGGICVAGDGRSVISGYTPAYAVENIAIWENILGFMWSTPALERSTWGEIKTLFDE
jgi:hypothetical protein